MLTRTQALQNMIGLKEVTYRLQITDFLQYNLIQQEPSLDYPSLSFATTVEETLVCFSPTSTVWIKRMMNPRSRSLKNLPAATTLCLPKQKHALLVGALAVGIGVLYKRPTGCNTSNSLRSRSNEREISGPSGKDLVIVKEIKSTSVILSLHWS